MLQKKRCILGIAKQSLLFIAITSLALITSIKTSAQSPNLGTMENFALFTSTGALSNAGTSDIWGSVGANVGALTGFGSPTTLNGGTTQSANTATAQGVIDVQSLYNQLLNTTQTVFGHAPAFGSGETLDPGVYAIAAAGSLAGTITLDGLADPNAIFIFKFAGAFTTGAASNVILSNGARACNVFWISGGAISMGASTQMKGTLISSPGAVSMAAGGTLEGRLLSTTGAIAISGALVYAPCASAPTGPPCATTGNTCNDDDTNTINDIIQNDCSCAGTSLGGIQNFALFTSTGALSNAGTSTINGHVGTNVGALTGFGSPSTLNGTTNAANAITAQGVIDVQNLYNQLLITPQTVFGHAPAFGSGEIVSPGVYTIAAAGSLAGTITLNGLGDPDAVFIFKFGGAFTTGAASNVILSNSAQSCNVFWISAGAISMGASTQMKGTLMTSPGAITMAAGGTLEGRLLSNTGAIAVSNALVLAPCPSLPAGTGCNDGDPNTINDVEDGNGNCAGINPNLCNSQGGDSDGDGVCDNQDCQPDNSAFPATPGTTCNDGDTNTINDVVQSDGCSCVGTSLGGIQNFALFTSTGALSNAGTSTVNGNVGTNVGALTGFGSPSTLNGTTNAANAATAQGVIDVQSLYNQLFMTTQTVFGHAPAFGSGETVSPGVYAIAAAGSLAGTITLNALGDPDAVFIFKFAGAFTTGAASNVILSNGAQSCNVFWISGGAISMGASTHMKGTLMTSPGAITMAAGGILEGRLLSTTGAIAVSNALVLAPCPSPPAGTGCNDGDPNTINDVEDGNGNCAGINPNLCDSQGGDSDGDGVCNDQDCQPGNSAFPATPGTTCDDGNINTINDVVQSDGCSCAGTNLGGVQNFTLFTSTGALSNAGTSTVNGNVGTNVGALTGFGSPSTLNGTAHAANAATAQGVIDVQSLYSQLFITPQTVFGHAPAFGSGETVDPGVYAIAAAGSLAGTITLDGLGNSGTVFIFKFAGAFTTGAASNVILINGAQSCNVFWISGGAISMGASTHMKGTLISSPGAITMAAGGVLEGRLLSTTGAIAISNALVVAPCAPTTCDDLDATTENDVEDEDGNCAGIPCPVAETCCDDNNPLTENDKADGNCNCVGTYSPPSLGAIGNFALFTSTGAVSNAGTSNIWGSVGANVGAVTGFVSPTTLNGGTTNAANVATAGGVTDVQSLYNQLYTTPQTVFGHAPAFGSGETVSPGIYAIAAAGSLAGMITLNGLGDPDAVFIFKFAGAFTTGAASNVILSNSAQSCNVFWISGGAISMGASTHMKGTLISNPGAVTMAAGGILDGRLLSTTGAIAISGATITLSTCSLPSGSGTPCTSPPAFAIPNMVSFNAKKDGIRTQVDWIMAKDVEVDFYEVEVSTDGNTFTLLNELDAARSNSPRHYEAIDLKPAFGENFYRLKVNQLDGSFFYSNIRRVNFKIDFDQVIVYPNPATDNFHIALRDFAGKAGTIEIYNSFGQKMTGRNYLSLPTIPAEFDVSGFTNGMYLISIKVENHRRFTKKFIVSRL
jgi:hypothetical protein